jgi:hypothetical protein
MINAQPYIIRELGPICPERSSSFTVPETQMESLVECLSVSQVVLVRSRRRYAEPTYWIAQRKHLLCEARWGFTRYRHTIYRLLNMGNISKIISSCPAPCSCLLRIEEGFWHLSLRHPKERAPRNAIGESFLKSVFLRLAFDFKDCTSLFYNRIQ